jgi:hypothetical protein
MLILVAVVTASLALAWPSERSQVPAAGHCLQQT